MNINNSIKTKIKDLLWNYGINDYELEMYLSYLPGSKERRDESVELIQEIMTTHGKESLHKYLSELGRIEAGIKELEPWVRDHVSHAILCYIVGIFINEHYMADNFNIRIQSFQWKLAGLFHDIGYPIEIAQHLLTPYNQKIDEIGAELGLPAEKEPIFKVSHDKLINLTNKKNSLNLIQNRLSEWGLKIDVVNEYKIRQQSGKVCHGIISSLLLLKVLDKMYEAYNPKREYIDTFKFDSNINWNQHNFENDIVSACSAIFIHNLPSVSFNGVRINPCKAPLAFILKLADTLQDWERSSKDLPAGISSNLFDLEYEDNAIKIITSIEKDRVDKINKEISDFLEVDNILVDKV